MKVVGRFDPKVVGPPPKKCKLQQGDQPPSDSSDQPQQRPDYFITHEAYGERICQPQLKEVIGRLESGSELKRFIRSKHRQRYLMRLLNAVSVYRPLTEREKELQTIVHQGLVACHQIFLPNSMDLLPDDEPYDDDENYIHNYVVLQALFRGFMARARINKGARTNEKQQ